MCTLRTHAYVDGECHKANCVTPAALRGLIFRKLQCNSIGVVKEPNVDRRPIEE